MDDNGKIKVSQINVFDVLEVFDDEFRKETKRAKKLRALKNQTSLDFK